MEPSEPRGRGSSSGWDPLLPLPPTIRSHLSRLRNCFWSLPQALAPNRSGKGQGRGKPRGDLRPSAALGRPGRFQGQQGCACPQGPRAPFLCSARSGAAADAPQLQPGARGQTATGFTSRKSGAGSHHALGHEPRVPDSCRASESGLTFLENLHLPRLSCSCPTRNPPEAMSLSPECSWT